MKWRFDIGSFIICLIIFLLEAFIAIFVDDSIIRPYGGDVLVVILMYYFLKSFIEAKTVYQVVPVVLFAYLIEAGQHFKLVEALGLQDNTIMRVVIGSSFSWTDIACYTIGGAICYFINKERK